MSGSPKHYRYVTMDFEAIDRMRQGESFTAFAWLLRMQWAPGNESFWDDYDAESLVDTDLKRQFTENVHLYVRVCLYRELRSLGFDTDGRDPLKLAWRVPELIEGLKARFPELDGQPPPCSPATSRGEPRYYASR